MSAKPTLGAYLRRGRERSGLSIEAVAAGSRIVPRLVEALEADRQEFLPAPVYVRGFLSEYARALGLDADRVKQTYLDRYRAARGHLADTDDEAAKP